MRFSRILTILLLIMSTSIETKAEGMNVRKIEVSRQPRAIEVPALMDSLGIAADSIACANWAAFPYRPEVRFRMAHTGKAILLHFSVDEQVVRAEIDSDSQPVYFDSCVEFFAQLDPDLPEYYNFETNCIGRMLVMRGVSQNVRTYAPPEALALIDRWSSLGSEPFGLREQPTHWELALVIPGGAFFLDDIADLSGLTVRGNVYKCGDKLPVPHYTSWRPIDTPRPLFHAPASFAPIHFEE